MSNQDAFETEYCSKCFEPTMGRCKGNCPTCGEPLVPISFEERLKRGGKSGKVSGIFYKAAQITIAAAYAVHLAYCVRGIVRLVSGYTVKPVMSVMIGHWNEKSIFQPIEYYGLFPIAAMGALALLILAYGVTEIISNNPKELRVFVAGAEGFGQLMIFTRNFLGFGLLFAALLMLIISELVIGRKKPRDMRLKQIYKKRYGAVDSKEWRCERCGYINVKNDSECKSCGKYK
ncbi:MAG: hypothetical protein HDT43_13165 [Ruminococcaceae bacterium]|nr:hypothetical protein [Oscillospiraceae bacterium]